MSAKDKKKNIKIPVKACNIELSEKIIIQLVNIHGVKTFCLCPGGRSAPLISVVSRAKGLEVFSFFDERAAGFFALGRCKRDRRPSVVITTSGTAVAELLPSVIEAYYSHKPLILLTADRPSSYRATGAPQSIAQPGIFSHYVEKQWDLEKDRNFDLSSWKALRPCHINVCFDEPLIDREAKRLSFSVRKPAPPFRPSLIKEKQKISSFFHKVKNPVCILAELPEGEIKKNVENILRRLGRPVYAEALSGLRDSKKLQPLILKSGPKFLNKMVLDKKTDAVLRIGRRPLVRFWRDLEKHPLPVLSISDQAYSGLSYAPSALSFESFFKWAEDFIFKSSYGNPVSLRGDEKTLKKTVEDIFKSDRRQREILENTIKKHPFSEPALVREFSLKIPERSFLFLGNSLPVREWDLTACYSKGPRLKYSANRGANGIDGLLSTFLGMCEPGRQNWCLIGDLSCLYDLSAPWILRQLKKNIPCFIVVINNRGGRIFSPLFSDPLFLNSHELSFKPWARMWGLHYYCLKKWPKAFSFSSPALIELKVDPHKTEQFHASFKKDLKNKKAGLD